MRSTTGLCIVFLAVVQIAGCMSEDASNAPDPLRARFLADDSGTGACCIVDGTCRLLIEIDCAGVGGSYQGDGTSCEPNPCPPSALGACCLDDGSCELLIEAHCALSEGLYLGASVNCEVNPCVTSEPVPPAEPEGCGLGYWKNHPRAWLPTGHLPEELVGRSFALPPELNMLARDSFLKALKYAGGSGIAGAARLLVRDAVVALLNASHPDVNFPLTEPQVVSMVNDGLASMDRRVMMDVRQTLDRHNMEGCPLH